MLNHCDAFVLIMYGLDCSNVDTGKEDFITCSSRLLVDFLIDFSRFTGLVFQCSSRGRAYNDASKGARNFVFAHDIFFD